MLARLSIRALSRAAARPSFVTAPPLQTLAVQKTAYQKYSTAAPDVQTTPAAEGTPKKKPMTVNAELPDPLAEGRKVRWQFALFSVLVALGFVGIVNYEKLSSPMIGSTMHFLRRSPKIRELLGGHVDFVSFFPWIRGQFNQVKGIMDISFKIKGDNGKIGTVILKADRPNRNVPLTVHEWSITVDDKKYDIMTDESAGYLE